MMTDEAKNCPHCGAVTAPPASAPPPPTDAERFEALLKRAHGKPLFKDFGALADDYDLENEGAPGCGLVAQTLITWARLWQRFDPAVAAAIFPISSDMIEAAAPAIDDYMDQPRPAPDGRAFADLIQMLMGQTFCTVADMAAMTNSKGSDILIAVADHPFLSLGDMSGISPTIWLEGI